MYASYNQLLSKRTKVHVEQILDYEDPMLSREEKTRRIEYNYGLIMKMLKAEVVLFAEMICSFGPFIYLPGDQRVGGRKNWIFFYLKCLQNFSHKIFHILYGKPTFSGFSSAISTTFSTNMKGRMTRYNV